MSGFSYPLLQLHPILNIETKISLNVENFCLDLDLTGALHKDVFRSTVGGCLKKKRKNNL
jgi:hypothetical protein